MYLWELIAYRLRVDGWSVWHRRGRDADGDGTYVVQLQRPGQTCRASGPTLTEAFAEAARRAREAKGAGGAAKPGRIAEAGPHFGAPQAVAAR